MIGTEIGGSLLLCTYGSWYLVVVDGHFEAAMLQLLMLAEYVAFR